jgi:hypothetical protein
VDGELLIGWIQVRLVDAGSRDAGFGVIGDEQLRAALVELQSVHLHLEPVRHLLVGNSLGVGVAGDSERGDEKRRLGHAAVPMMDRDGCASPVQK